MCRCLKRPEEGIIGPGASIMGGCESQCGCWELNSSPWEDQYLLLITKPSLHHFVNSFSCCLYSSAPNEELIILR